MASFIFVLIVSILFLFILGVGALLMARLVQRDKQRIEIERRIALLPNFAPTLRFENGWVGIQLDAMNNKFAITTTVGSEPVRLFSFDQLVAVEVERNGSSLQKTNRDSQIVGAAVGAAILGPVGLLLGGLSGSKRHEETIKRLALKLYTNDLHAPFHEITFFSDAVGQKPDSGPVTTAARQLDEWYGRFQTILRMQNRNSGDT